MVTFFAVDAFKFGLKVRIVVQVADSHSVRLSKKASESRSTKSTKQIRLLAEEVPL